MTTRILQIQEQIISLYRDEKKSISEISDLLHINLKTVRRVLHKNNIEVRGSKKNLLSLRFGRLEAIKYVKTDNSQKSIWECWCDCGNKTEVRAADLMSGKVKSCGCYRSETSRENVKNSWKKYPRSPNFKGIKEITGGYLSRIKNQAMRRGIEYSITKEFLWDLYIAQNKKCNLTGLDIWFGRRQTASLDRIDSSKGYVKDNLQWVHKDINNIKQDYTMMEFLTYCKLIYEKHFTKN